MDHAATGPGRIAARRPLVPLVAAALCAGVAGALLSVLIAAPDPSAAPLAAPALAAAPTAAWASVPPAPRLAVSRALGGDDRAFWLRDHRAANPSQHFAVQARAGGVAVNSARGTFGLSLRTAGAAGRPVIAAAPRIRENRITYARGPLTEWYANGPLGLEQGVDVARPLGARGEPLELTFAVTGSLRPVAFGGGLDLRDGSGTTALRYGQLSAVDARGRSLAAALSLRDGRVVLRISTAGARYPLHIDPLTQQAQLTASDGTANQDLPSAVAISGDTIAIGVNDAKVAGNLQGAVYVFEKPASGWTTATQTAELVASDAGVNHGAYGDVLGSSVAISGDTIVAGAPRAANGGKDYAGMAYVFQRPVGGHWVNSTQDGELVASDIADDEFFASSVATDGNTIAVSGNTNSVFPQLNAQGAVYVYPRPAGGHWTSAAQTAKLTASDGAAGDVLGTGLGVAGDTIVAGAPFATADSHVGQGALYVFETIGGVWTTSTQVAKLTASNGSGDETMGWSTVFDGTTIVAGAPHNRNPGSSSAEAAYVFTKPVGGWATSDAAAVRLTPSDPVTAEHFGTSVGLSGATIAVSAPFAPFNGTSQQGAFYVYAKPAGGWASATETAKGSATGGNIQQANSIALSGTTLVEGAPYATAGGHNYQGAAYVFDTAGSGTTTTDTTAPPTTTTTPPTTTFANPGGHTTTTFVSTTPPPVEVTWGDIAAGLFGITPRSGQTVNIGQFVFVAACKQGQTCNGAAVYSGNHGSNRAVAAKTKAKPKAVVYAKAKFSIPGGKRKNVTFNVTKAGRALLKKHHGLTGTIAVTVSRAGSSTGHFSHRFTLKYRPKKSKHR